MVWWYRYKKMELSITRQGVEIPKTHAQMSALVRKDLCVAPVSLNDPYPKKFKVYLDLPTKYIVPLHWARAALKNFGVVFKDVRTPATPAPALAEFKGALRTELNQPEAVKAVVESWKTCGGAMLCLPVGFGKTTCALYLASLVKTKTMVLVHKSFLKEQWQERIAQYLPNAKVTEIQGTVCDTSGDIVVAMIQTLISREFSIPDVGLVAIDEVHHLGAAAFSQCMWGLGAPKVLGLSATPTRKDGLSRVVEWFCGPVAYQMKRENQATTVVDVARFTCPEFDAPPPVNRRGDICFTSIISRLVENQGRTRAIASRVAALAAKGRNVLVLTHRRQHCSDIRDLLVDLQIDAGTYVGGDKACPDTRVIVATYALTSEGFDLPRLDALVLATPASDVEQSCGRVMRGHSRGSIIVDIVDAWGPCFAQHAKRRGFYKRSGFTMSGTTPAPPSDQPPPPQTCVFLDD